MDPNLSVGIASQSPQTPKKRRFLIVVALAIILVIIVIFALNYFRVLPVSKIVPVLNSLPQTTPNQNVAQSVSITIPCPVAKNYCNSGKPIYDGSNFLGIGFKLPQGEKVYSVAVASAFFSAVQDSARGVTIHPKVFLGWNLDGGAYTATYDFFGLSATQSVKPKTVESGEALGTISGDVFPSGAPFDGINLLFSVEQNGKVLQINNSNFAR